MGRVEGDRGRSENRQGETGGNINGYGRGGVGGRGTAHAGHILGSKNHTIGMVCSNIWRGLHGKSREYGGGSEKEGVNTFGT